MKRLLFSLLMAGVLFVPTTSVSAYYGYRVRPVYHPHRYYAPAYYARHRVIVRPVYTPRVYVAPMAYPAYRYYQPTYVY